jgi:hypothetical protein
MTIRHEENGDERATTVARLRREIERVEELPGLPSREALGKYRRLRELRAMLAEAERSE